MKKPIAKRTKVPLMLRGLFGPSKKMMQRVSDGLERKQARTMHQMFSQFIEEILLKKTPTVFEEKEKELRFRTKVRMAAKYSLDALDIRDRKTRHFVQDRINEIAKRYNQKARFGRLLSAKDVIVKESVEQISERLGKKAPLFFSFFFRKGKRLTKSL